MRSPLWDSFFEAKPEELDFYRRMIYDDHRLYQAIELIDFDDFLPQLNAGYSDKYGYPAIPPMIGFKLELLKYWYNLSDRQVIERAETDVAFRYFLKVPIDKAMPHSTLLTRFRGRFGEQGYRKLFQTLVRQARQKGIVKDQLRLKDATHIFANISVPSTLVLAAQIREQLIDSLQNADPEAAQGFRIATEQVRQQTKDQDDPARLLARIELLGDIVATCSDLPPEVKLSKRQKQKLDEALQLAKRLLGQHQNPKTPGKLRSASDPEAGRGKHGVYYDGYVTDIAMDPDSELITAIDVLPAGGNEAESAVRLIEQEHEHQGNQVEAISIDGAGHNGEMIRRFEGDADDPQDDGMGVTVYVPPKKDRSDVAIAASEFTVSEDGSTVTCPEGQTSSYRQESSGSTVYRFARTTCQGCPLQAACAPKLGKTPFGRSVSKGEYTDEYERIRGRAQTEAFAEVRRRHPAVERKLNECVNHHGSRRARYRGRSKVAIQQIGVAMVVNAKRMIKLLLSAASCADGSATAQTA
ncbi:hypothetical protein LF1_36900 [Rubripirellula obstinata]|uniref:Transposase DDE domain protein n=1 Tax=Rubripirellula obstinata TaxID=406547 RepID=A0A5B1CKS1_9BACT|nr:IS1182 family transposase [Rubripirellula obstinata]KAA1258982.1 hypothetical protein LF1_15070 [Rubripirellula obstinata]KAA1260806.1 hypothetical protein LF1_33480 [Rubripirellula obstinata]KAA1261146.1 hypothetical protein LF1_36900 [Rubripirellula obstinata]